MKKLTFLVIAVIALLLTVVGASAHVHHKGVCEKSGLYEIGTNMCKNPNDEPTQRYYEFTCTEGCDQDFTLWKH